MSQGFGSHCRTADCTATIQLKSEQIRARTRGATGQKWLRRDIAARTFKKLDLRVEVYSGLADKSEGVVRIDFLMVHFPLWRFGLPVLEDGADLV